MSTTNLFFLFRADLSPIDGALKNYLFATPEVNNGIYLYSNQKSFISPQA